MRLLPRLLQLHRIMTPATLRVAPAHGEEQVDRVHILGITARPAGERWVQTCRRELLDRTLTAVRFDAESGLGGEPVDEGAPGAVAPGRSACRRGGGVAPGRARISATLAPPAR